MDCSTPGLPASSRSLLKLMSIESMMPSNHLILCRPLRLPPSVFPSIRVFSNESTLCIRWPKYWSCGFRINPSSYYSGLVSFGMDWFDDLAVQETLKNLLQHHSSKASILWCSAFFIVQLSHPLGSLVAQLIKESACNVGDLGLIPELGRSPGEGKGSPLQYSGLENFMDCVVDGRVGHDWATFTFSHPYMTSVALTIWTFVGKVMSLLFNVLSRFLIAFLPRSKCLLIWWQQSPSAVTLKPKKIKSVTVSIVSPFICHEVMGPAALLIIVTNIM